MRQIERECNKLDWTHGAGLSSRDSSDQLYSGGAYKLGGSESSSTMSPRELAARAAEMRMTTEEKEIEQNCGCGGNDKGLFLPDNMKHNQSDTEGDSMDTSC